MKIKLRYQLNKETKVGNECVCPSCNTKFVKTNYQQVFCKSKNGTVCKDKYWNTVTPNKRNNKTRISPASARWLAENKTESFEKILSKNETKTTTKTVRYSGVLNLFEEKENGWGFDEGWDGHK